MWDMKLLLDVPKIPSSWYFKFWNPAVFSTPLVICWDINSNLLQGCALHIIFNVPIQHEIIIICISCWMFPAIVATVLLPAFDCVMHLWTRLCLKLLCTFPLDSDLKNITKVCVLTLELLFLFCMANYLAKQLFNQLNVEIHCLKLNLWCWCYLIEGGNLSIHFLFSILCNYFVQSDMLLSRSWIY